MVMDISYVFYFMPVFSFLFVFIVTYAVLAKSKVLGDERINLLVSLIMAIIFLNFSSLELYVRTITPWFVVLLVCLLFVLMLIGFIGNDLMKKMVTKGFGWALVIILLIIFLIAAIRVFNPMFHPDLIVTSGNGPGMIYQLRQVFDTRIGGSVLLLVIAGVVAWFLTSKAK